MKRDQSANSLPRPKWLVFTCLIGAAVSVFGPSSASAAHDCASLANLKIDNTDLLSATEVGASGDLPAYCRVLGFVRPAINFEIKLPVQGWNGKLYMVGCGGFCGTLNTEAPGFQNAMNFGLRRNYAVSTSDSGHWGAGSLAQTPEKRRPSKPAPRSAARMSPSAGCGHGLLAELRQSAQVVPPRSVLLPISEAAMTATATTAIRIVQIALISGFTPSRTSE
jgi:Tannase and feruloyl esterase